MKLSVVARRSKEKAQAAVSQAEAALSEATAEADRAGEALAKAEAEWQAARDRLLEAQKAVGVATTGEQAARADRDERRRDSTRAGIGVRDAEKRLDQARRSPRPGLSAHRGAGARAAGSGDTFVGRC